MSFSQNYHINYEHITTKNGLSNDFVNHIIQDSEGLIWIATQDGLNRYDGYSFEIFRAKPYDEQGLPSNIILSLMEDKEGNIWVGTEKGVAKWNRKTNTIRRVTDLPQKSIAYIYQDQDESIWFAGLNTLHRINSEGENQSFSEYFLKKNQTFIRYIGEITLFGKSQLVVIGEEGNFLRYLSFFDRKTQTYQTMLKTQGFIEHINQTGEVLICYEKHVDLQASLQNYSNGLLKVKAITYPNLTVGMSRGLANVQSNRNIWCIGGQEIFLVNPQNSEVLQVLDKNHFTKDLDQYQLKGLMKDQNSNFWLYGNGFGIFLFPEYSIDNIKLYNFQEGTQGLSGNSVRTVYQHTDGELWVVTYNNENANLNYIDVLTPNKSTERVPLDGIAYTIVPDKDKKTIWVGTHLKHLYKIDKQSKKILKKYSERGSKVLKLSDNIFLTDAHFLSTFNTKTEEWKNYGQDILSCFYRSQDGNIWLGSLNSGLGLLDVNTMKSQYFSHQTADSTSISSNFVKAIYEDRKERLWVATTLGLNLFNKQTKTFTAFTENEGLPNNMVYGILEDKEGNLWLSTNKGISKFNPETQNFINYDESYGLQNNEFNTNAFFQNERTGEMFFGGIKGLNSFYPEKMTLNEFPPKVVWTNFKREGKKVVLEKPLTETAKVEMDYHEAQSLSFEFVALNYFQSNKNQYAYKIEEVHEDWIGLSTKHEINLNTLNAGTHTLYIKGSNNHGIWSEKALSITLIVKPPFWQTWWFKFISLVFFFSLLYGAYRWRVHQIRRRELYLEKQVKIRTEEVQTQAEALEELNKTKDHLFSIIAHDLRSPIVAFQGINDQIRYFTRKQQPEKIEELSTFIAQSSQNLNNLLDNLLYWATSQQNILAPNLQSVNLTEIVENLYQLFESSILENNIQLKHTITDNTHIDSDLNMLTTILRNLISNAIKFTPTGGKISIHFSRDETHEIIYVSDTGIGIKTHQKEQLFKGLTQQQSTSIRGEKGMGIGLKICYDLAQLLSYEIKIQSEENVGTTFQIIKQTSN